MHWCEIVAHLTVEVANDQVERYEDVVRQLRTGGSQPLALADADVAELLGAIERARRDDRFLALALTTVATSLDLVEVSSHVKARLWEAHAEVAGSVNLAAIARQAAAHAAEAARGMEDG